MNPAGNEGLNLGLHLIMDMEIMDNHSLSGSRIYSMRLKTVERYPAPLPGQFVNIYLRDKSRILPRPFSVCDWDSNILTLVYAVAGEGTAELSRYEKGSSLRVSTPLGKGFNIKEGSPCLLAGGGLGIVPLVYAAKCFKNKTFIQGVFGFKNKTFLLDAFDCPKKIATEDGSTGIKGNVSDILRTMEITGGTQLCACGPKPMLRALHGFAKERNLPLQVSMEERFGCGYGACVGCVCKTISGNKKVCEDGPVFDSNEVIWDD